MCLVTVSGAGHIKECPGGCGSSVRVRALAVHRWIFNLRTEKRAAAPARGRALKLCTLSRSHAPMLPLTLFYLFSPLFLLPSLIDMNRKLISGILPALPIFVAYFCAPLRTLQSCRKGISQLHMMITLNMTLYTAAHTPPPHTHTHT